MLEFENTGAATCTLDGYPGVSLDGSSGPVGASATRAGGSATRVTLAPDAKGYALLGIHDAAVYDSSTCQPASVNGLLVYPPNQTQSLSVPDQVPDGGCENTSVSLLTIKPVAPTEAAANS
jgi:hypothetical protein